MNDYEYVIKQIFNGRKNNSNININNNISLKSNRSQNFIINTKNKEFKENKLKQYIERIKEINLTTDENNNLNKYQLNNNNKNKINKEEMNILESDSYSLSPELINLDKENKPQKNEYENNDKIILKEYQKNIMNKNKNLKNNINSLNEILSYTQRIKGKNEVKNQLSTNSTTERNLKENLSASRKIINQIKNKFERYNTENLMYEALKNYSQCKPLNSGFLDRMEFYTIKKQTKNEILNYLVNQSKPKIKESERIKVFNHLIEDSNRRTENYYKNEELKNKKKISKKKFNEREFLLKYKREVIDKLKEKERNLQLLRKAKLKEEREKEELIIKEMRNRTQRASKKKIEEIFKRLYAEAVSFNARKEIRNSFNDNNDNNIFSLDLKKERNFSHLNLNSINHSFNQNYNKKQKLRYRYYSQKNIHQPEIYKKYNCNMLNRNKHSQKSCCNVFNKNNVKISTKIKKFVPIFNAEKMVDAFFTKKK